MLDENSVNNTFEFLVSQIVDLEKRYDSFKTFLAKRKSKLELKKLQPKEFELECLQLFKQDPYPTKENYFDLAVSLHKQFPKLSATKIKTQICTWFRKYREHCSNEIYQVCKKTIVPESSLEDTLKIITDELIDYVADKSRVPIEDAMKRKSFAASRIELFIKRKFK